MPNSTVLDMRAPWPERPEESRRRGGSVPSTASGARRVSRRAVSGARAAGRRAPGAENMTKTVMITGAGSGFGKGASLALVERGHTVIATTETDAQADALRAAAPQLTVEKLDITSADVKKAAAWDIDVLINNAGAGQTGPMADVPLDRVRHLFEVNVFGTLAVTQQVIPGMVKR